MNSRGRRTQRRQEERRETKRRKLLALQLSYKPKRKKAKK